MPMTKTPKAITPGADVIDSRDVIERIAYLDRILRAQHEDWRTDGDDDDVRIKAGTSFDDWLEEQDEDGDDEAHELRALLALQNEAECCGDWTHGAALINIGYFEDYAREMAADIYGKQISEATWPFSHIDWEAAAEALKIDYLSVTFDGEDYLVRS